jgi:hypothetical protein
MLNTCFRYSVFIYSFIICISIVLTSHLANDDHMYLGAAHMLSQGEIYRDFTYAQTPYMPYIYKFIFDIFGNNYLVLQSRITEIAIILAILIYLYKLSSLLSGNKLYAVFSVFLLVNLSVFQDTIHFARNYNMSMLLCLMALFCIEKYRDHGKSVVPYLFAGIFLGMAIGVKLTYLTFVPLFFLVALTETGVTKLFFRLASVFTAGIIVGLLPAGIIFYSTGLELPLFNFLHFFQLNIQWRQESGFQGPMNLIEKTQYFRQILLSCSLLLTVILFQIFSHLHHRKSFEITTDRLTQRYLLLILLSVPMFLLPSPIWVGYFSMFVVALVLFSGVLFKKLGEDQKRSTAVLAVSLCSVMLFSNILLDGKRIASLASLENWNGLKIHRIGETIRENIAPNQLKRPVATLSPIYALEAGLPIYRELAAGPFYYRVGHLLKPSELRRYNMTSRTDISRLLDSTPPSAILVGYDEENLEKPLVDYAQSRGFTRMKKLRGGGILYTKGDR